MKLRHLHLPGLTPYLHASSIQEHLVRQQLDYKLLGEADRKFKPPPPPSLITFQTPPTYTCGRREVGKLTPQQIEHLRAGGNAEFYETLRGGQTTFHGPGQLTAYLILSLQTLNWTSRQHIRFLEDSVIATCKQYAIDGFRSDNPGVWTASGDKIASVGVHLRRYTTSHGIGLNVGVDLEWFNRIVMCGLPEKRATSLEKEGCQGKSVDEVANVFAETVAIGLGSGHDGLESVSEEALRKL